MEKRGEGYLLAATHSGLRPADFPLGSLESRAAVRALLTTQISKTRKSQVEVYPRGWSSKTAAQKAALDSLADILFFGGAGKQVRLVRRSGHHRNHEFCVEVRKGLCRELPAWMFDAALCAAMSSGPSQVSLKALQELRAILSTDRCDSAGSWNCLKEEDRSQ